MSRAPIRVLVVDDERYLADLVAMALRYDGFDTAVASSGAEARAVTTSFAPDLILLDAPLPEISGRSWRRDGRDVPVVFLAKPFSLQELTVRVRTVLRARTDHTLSLADLELDAQAHEVRRHGEVVDLTPTEFTLLHYLLANAGQVLTKQQILAHVWQYDFNGDAAVVQTYISYLRRKIDRRPPRLIHTVTRVGYVLRLPPG
ncbi:response regulator transcription factor [Crossiella sp. SN42]|uniref:response regulator transcription factor n=1 Tax=Crossiella sp. SN42 TaxID=2944808 RepID=UPI00207CEE77|nr:response regulator transcription factor [Crossiella sp. SN42]MCO1581959.1 response regulator transcription factor [Crossiella sp. SN42]